MRRTSSGSCWGFTRTTSRWNRSRRLPPCLEDAVDKRKSRTSTSCLFMLEMCPGSQASGLACIAFDLHRCGIREVLGIIWTAACSSH
jgi:hypothetical protein